MTHSEMIRSSRDATSIPLRPSIRAVVFGCLLVTAFTSTASIAETTPDPVDSPEAVIDQIKKCVVFLRGSYTFDQTVTTNGVAQRIPRSGELVGTAFFIAVPEPRLGPAASFSFLVTNKHMIRAPGPSGIAGEGPYFKTVTARINILKTNLDGTQYAQLPLSVLDDTGSLLWLTDSSDESVDLALTPFAPAADIFAFKQIPSTIFATKDVLKRERISENDEVLFSGLFAWHPGAKRNYPIVRHGKLARLSEERIPLDREHPEKTTEAHLADVMSFGGNSGSPVLLRVGGIRDLGASTGYSYYLLGVMQGFFPEDVDFAIRTASLRGFAAQNSGIAAVVPADAIMRILESPRARAFRDRVVAGEYARRGNMEDADKLFKVAISLLEARAPRHSDLAAALEGHADLLQQEHRDRQAKVARDRAERIRSDVNTDGLHPRL